jgi:hypothetical protein
LIGVAIPTTFHDREHAFEARFARDEEFRFVAAARRDKLLARWAAIKLRLSDEATEALVKEVIAIPNGPEHDQALLQHIAAFLSARDAGVPEKDLLVVLGECIQQAVRQLTQMPPDHSDVI